MHNDYDLKQEQLNKSALLSSKKFLENLMDILLSHVVNIIYNQTKIGYKLLYL